MNNRTPHDRFPLIPVLVVAGGGLLFGLFIPLSLPAVHPAPAALAMLLCCACAVLLWLRRGGIVAWPACVPFIALWIPILFFPDYLIGAGPSIAVSLSIMAISLLCHVALRFLVFSPSSTAFHTRVSRSSLTWSAVLTIAYTGACLVCGIVRYYHFAYAGLDLGIYIQSFWTALQGKLFWNTHEVYPAGSTFGIHFSPIMFLLLIPFKFWPGGVTLITLKVLSLGLGGLVVYRIARDMLGGYAGLCFCACFLLYPGIQYQIHGEYYLIFHAPIFLLLAISYFNRGKFWPFLIALILACSAREEIALTTFFFGIYAVMKRRGAVWIWCPLVLSAIWFFLSIWVLIPSHGPGAVLRFYKNFGGSVDGIVAASLRDPAAILSRFFSPDLIKLVYLLVMPLGLIPPLLGPELVCAVPSLCIAALSWVPQTRSIYYYYYLPAVPFLFWSAMTGVGKLAASRFFASREPADAIAVICTLMLFVSLAVFVRGPLAEMTIRDMTRPYNVSSGSGYNETLWKAMALIPDDARVFAPRYIKPHLATRGYITAFYAPNADYLIVDTHTEDAMTVKVQNIPFIRSLEENTDYQKIFDENGVMVWGHSS